MATNGLIDEFLNEFIETDYFMTMGQFHFNPHPFNYDIFICDNSEICFESESPDQNRVDFGEFFNEFIYKFEWIHWNRLFYDNRSISL